MINLYIFLSILVGLLILMSIKVSIISNNNRNNNNHTNKQKSMLNYYGEYESLGNYSNYNI